MRTKSLKWPLFMSMAMLLALPVLFEGQTTEDQQRQQMGMESHVGKLMGRAKDGQKAYQRYCIGCHGALGDGAGEPGSLRQAFLDQVRQRKTRGAHRNSSPARGYRGKNQSGTSLVPKVGMLEVSWSR